MATHTIHCMDSTCNEGELTIQTPTTSNVPTLPKFCPMCGSTNLLTHDEYSRAMFIKSLAREGFTISETMYNKLMVRFRAQSGFKDFREFVGCVLFDDPVKTDKQIAQERAATRPTGNGSKAFKHSNRREPNTPLLGQFGGAAYRSAPHMPKAGN